MSDAKTTAGQLERGVGTPAARSSTLVLAAIHDINQALTIASAGLDILRDEPDDREKAICLISDGLERIGRLVREAGQAALDDQAVQLLAPWACVDIASLVARITEPYRLLAARHGCQVSLRVSSELPAVWLDVAQMERALANLLDNAVSITVAARWSDGRIAIDLTAASDGVQLVIADNGPGLDADALRFLGQSNTRLSTSPQRHGLGIGIMLSHRAIAAHGGKLSYASDGPGRGTTVTVWLPAVMEVKA